METTMNLFYHDKAHLIKRSEKDPNKKEKRNSCEKYGVYFYCDRVHFWFEK